MSAVDVLAVMEADASHAEAYRIAHGLIDSSPAAMALESSEARAAVAELIEAATKYRRSRSDFVIDTHGTEERFDAALARCKGGVA